MTAKVLIVDDIAANVRLLRAQLEADYFDVISASDGLSALQMAQVQQPDIILLDVMMPGLNGFDTCKRLKEVEDTRHIPIILITALDGREDRLSGLAAGADDFLTKPVDDLLLLARIKALVRVKYLVDELRLREQSSRKAGLFDHESYQRLMSAAGNVLILDDNEKQAARLMQQIGAEHRCAYETDPQKAIKIASGRVDLLLLNMGAKSFDPLRWLAHLRSNEATRSRPVLGLTTNDERPALLKAFELGISDIIFKPIDGLELMARIQSQIRRKRYTDFLRQSLDRSLEMAVIDTLTGLNNRRYMDGQLAQMMSSHIKGGPRLSLLMLDIDHFKKVNDRYGHDAGDEVLKEFAQRVSLGVRAVDMPCRMGGEEFVVLMPDTGEEDAFNIAERVRSAVAEHPFKITKGDQEIPVTVSVGVSTSMGLGDSIEALMKRADQAVYQAKGQGRNRVIVKSAA